MIWYARYGMVWWWCGSIIASVWQTWCTYWVGSLGGVPGPLGVCVLFYEIVQSLVMLIMLYYVWWLQRNNCKQMITHTSHNRQLFTLYNAMQLIYNVQPKIQNETKRHCLFCICESEFIMHTLCNNLQVFWIELNFWTQWQYPVSSPVSQRTEIGLN